MLTPMPLLTYICILVRVPGQSSAEVQLIEGISFNRLDRRKFLGWSRITSLPLVAIAVENFGNVRFNLSLTLQRIMLHRNATLRGGLTSETSEGAEHDSDSMSVFTHSTISNLLISTKPIRAARISCNWKEIRMSLGSYETNISLSPSVDKLYNSGGLTVSDIMGTLLQDLPPAGYGIAPWRATLPFLGLRLRAEAVERATHLARNREGGTTARSSGSCDTSASNTEPAVDEQLHHLEFMFDDAYSH